MADLKTIIDNARNNINEEAEKIATEAVEELLRQIAGLDAIIADYQSQIADIEAKLDTISSDPDGFREKTYGKHAYRTAVNKY